MLVTLIGALLSLGPAAAQESLLGIYGAWVLESEDCAKIFANENGRIVFGAQGPEFDTRKVTVAVPMAHGAGVNDKIARSPSGEISTCGWTLNMPGALLLIGKYVACGSSNRLLVRRSSMTGTDTAPSFCSTWIC